MTRVAVFGATGMVGSAVMLRFASLGIDTVGISRSQSGFDVAQPRGLGALLERCDVAINCIAILRSVCSDDPNGRVRLIAANSLWPQLLAATAETNGCRIVHFSTDAVFGPPAVPADELRVPRPVDPYGLSKLLGEVTAPNVVNIRLSVIGPSTNRPDAMWQWLLSQPLGARVGGFASSLWTGCTALQAAQLAADLCRLETFADVRSVGAVHHFVPNGATTKYELLVALARRLRPDVVVEARAEPEPWAAWLVTATNALEMVYRGVHGWELALNEYGMA